MRVSVFPLLSILLALTAVGAWQVEECRSQRDEHRAEHRAQGEAVLAAADGLATREFRGGRYDPKALAATMSQVVESFGLVGLSLANAEGESLASVGDVGIDMPSMHRFSKIFEPLRPRRLGRGPPWGESDGSLVLDEGPLILTLVLSSVELEAKLKQDLARSVVTSASIGLAVLLFVGVFWMRTRAAELRGELEAGQRELESLERLRRVGAGLVHETKNPLGVVRGFAERILRRQLEPAQLERAARAIVDETDRTVARLDEFLLFSRPAELRKTRFPVLPLFDELALLLDADIEAGRVNLVIDCCDAEIDGDREQLRRLFLNLLLNALQAIEPGGTIQLACLARSEGLELWVEDDGCGVPEALRETLFEPYVTTREGGSGLGLSIASRIAVDHGFNLRFEPNQPRGTRMILEGLRR